MEAVVVIACLVFSAFFSGMETAFVAANKVYLEVESRQSSFTSKILTQFTQNPLRFVTAMLVGNSIALVLCVYHVSGLIKTVLPSDVSFFWQITLQISVVTILVLITADFIPKVFFQVYANRLIKLLAVPAYPFYLLFYVVSYFLIPFVDFVLVKLLGLKEYVKKVYFTKGELGAYLREQVEAAVDEQTDAEIVIFKNALNFGATVASEIMTGRDQIVGVDINSSVAVLRQLFIDTGYSKIVVYKDSVHNVLGYVHSFALFKNPQSISLVMVPVVRVSESIYIKELLKLLTRRKRSMAVVLNEQGGTAGIVTTEDIVEELFGEIEDEHDLEVPVVKRRLSKNSWVFSARLEVAEINLEFGIALPEHTSYTTLGGLLVHFAEGVPALHDRVIVGDFVFEVEEASGQKIELIKILWQTFE